MHTHAARCGNATHGQRPTAFVHLHGVRNAEWVSQRGRERVSLHLVSISVCVCALFIDNKVRHWLYLRFVS